MIRAESCALIIAVAALAGAAAALQPKVVPGAEDWVCTSDIAPFSLGVLADFGTGGSGLNGEYFGRHPDNVAAEADYRDAARGIVVVVNVDYDARVAYLDHLVERDFRNAGNGRLHEPESSVVSLFGSVVLRYCEQPPNCLGRLYRWRSGPNVVVTVRADAYRTESTPGVESKTVPIACPEPTEILQAYLQRYPSSLQQFTDSAVRVNAWLRDRAALQLAAAKYDLDQTDATAVTSQDAKLSGAESHLAEFARLRQQAMNGPDEARERQRLFNTRALPGPSRRQETRKIWEEYYQWWQSHVGVPVEFFPTPGP